MTGKKVERGNKADISTGISAPIVAYPPQLRFRFFVILFHLLFRIAPGASFRRHSRPPPFPPFKVTAGVKAQGPAVLFLSNRIQGRF